MRWIGSPWGRVSSHEESIFCKDISFHIEMYLNSGRGESKQDRKQQDACEEKFRLSERFARFSLPSVYHMLHVTCM
jgi:hypothetical protein